MTTMGTPYDDQDPERPGHQTYKPGGLEAALEAALEVAQTRYAAGLEAATEVNKLNRDGILGVAAKLVSGNRANAYGDFGEQMRSLSRAFEGITGRELPPQDVAVLLMLLKLRRATTSSDQDSLVDLCGYAALYGEYFR